MSSASNARLPCPLCYKVTGSRKSYSKLKNHLLNAHNQDDQFLDHHTTHRIFLEAIKLKTSLTQMDATSITEKNPPISMVRAQHGSMMENPVGDPEPQESHLRTSNRRKRPAAAGSDFGTGDVEPSSKKAAKAPAMHDSAFAFPLHPGAAIDNAIESLHA